MGCGNEWFLGFVKRAREHKKRLEDQEKEERQANKAKWYDRVERPPVVVGSMENIKKRAEVRMKKMRAEKERKRRIDIGKKRVKRRAVERLCMEAQEILAFSVRPSAAASSAKGEGMKRVPAKHNRAWVPTGFQNQIEWTRGTKVTNSNLIRTFSYQKRKNGRKPAAVDEAWTADYERWIRNKTLYQPPQVSIKTWKTQ